MRNAMEILNLEKMLNVMGMPNEGVTLCGVVMRYVEETTATEIGC